MAFNIDLNADDFWNETSGNKFHFEDDDFLEDELFQGEEKDSLFGSTIGASAVIPLPSLTSKENLNFNIKVVSQDSGSSCNETIKSMFLGKPFQLVHFKMEQEKFALLNRAIESYDGNVILQVILFLAQTLKPRILYQYLSYSSVALEQYATYLMLHNDLHSLDLLYMATNCRSNMSLLFYLSTMHSSPDSQLKKLCKFNLEHSQNLLDSYEKSILSNHQLFLEFRQSCNVKSEVPTTLFAELCRDKIDNLSNVVDLMGLAKELKISDVKVEWVLLNVCAAHEKWRSIQDIFQKSNWFSKKTTIKSKIPCELVAYCLFNHDAPCLLIEEFLKKHSDVEKSIYLGKKFKCHQLVVNLLISSHDKQGLLEYRSKVTSDPNLLKIVDEALFLDQK